MFNPSFLTLAEVDALADRLHAGQVDKAGLPYINHPRAVAAALEGLGLEVQAAALLHDAIEDTEATAETLLAARVDPAAVRLVGQVTRPEGEGRPTYRDWVWNLSHPASYAEPVDFLAPEVLDSLGLKYSVRIPKAAALKLADNAHNSRHERQAVLPEPVSVGLTRRYSRTRASLIPVVTPDLARLIFSRINPGLLVEV